MRLLTIGIDAGDEEILKALPLPHFHEFFRKHTSIQIEEDLWSRGWVNILSGKTGHDTGAFYVRPVLKKTHASTQKFDPSFYHSSEIQPLWKVINETGYKVGFMNVPSMMPAPEVDGFVVSGGGAGASTSGASSIPVSACFPKHIKSILETNDYVLDTRFVASGVTDLDRFIKQLMRMAEARVRTYLQLCKNHQPDFGFIAFMALNRIQCLAMSEVEGLIQNGNTPQNQTQEKILSLYQTVDKLFGLLLEELPYKHIMLIADHGQSPKRYTVDLNYWLKESGFQVSANIAQSGTKKIIKTLAKCLPGKVKTWLKQTAPNSVTHVASVNANWAETKAFSFRCIPGIYLNDFDRFGGRTFSEKDKSRLIESIIEAFNQNEQNIEHKLKAVLYREELMEKSMNDLFPDIWIDHDDAYFFEQSSQYITKNEAYGPIESVANVKSDLHTGIKGRYPLMYVDKRMNSFLKDGDKYDLTLAYNLIVRCMTQ